MAGNAGVDVAASPTGLHLIVWPVRTAEPYAVGPVRREWLVRGLWPSVRHYAGSSLRRGFTTGGSFMGLLYPDRRGFAREAVWHVWVWPACQGGCIHRCTAQRPEHASQRLGLPDAGVTWVKGAPASFCPPLFGIF